MPLERNKLPVWDLGGGLNELNSPSEAPSRDMIYVRNWKWDKDGTSRVKRPGYDKLDTGYTSINEAVRGVFEYEDINNNQQIVVVGDTRITQRQNVYTWTRMFLDEDGDYALGYRVAPNYGEKFIFIDNGPDPGKLQCMQTSDGSTYTQLFEDATPLNVSTSQACAVAVFNDEIFYGGYELSLGNNIITRYDGAVNYECPAAWGGTYTLQMLRWDGKLWIVFYRGSDFKIYYYNGVSYSAIGNYGGSSTIVTNTPSGNRFAAAVRPRMARLFVWNNELYFFCTVYNTPTTKWRWQIWKFNTTLYDRFTKIYEHTTNDDYGVCSVYEWDNKPWVVLQKFAYGADYAPDGNNNIVLSSSGGLTTWTTEQASTALGCVMGETIYDGKVFINTLYDWNTNNHTRIAYWDDNQKNFIQEMLITTNAPAGSGGEGSGGFVQFKGELYVVKWKEVYKRELSTNAYTEIYSTSEAHNAPVAGAYWHHRLYVAHESILVLEGDDVYYLGINAPTTAPSAATGAAGVLSGDYKYVVTYQRSGNYPVESNPSPESATVSPATQQVDLSSIPISTDPKVNSRRIYRTTAGGERFYWLVDIDDNSTTTYVDDIDDDTLLGGDEVSYDRYPPPQGKYMEVWDNRLWIGGIPDYPNYTFYTNTGTSEEMASTNFLAYKLRTSEKMRQIKAYGDQLYVFFETFMFRVDKIGESMYEVTELPQNIGTIAPWSVAVCDNFMIWLSSYGIEVFNGNRCFRPIVSEMVRNTLANLNESALDKVVGGHNFKDHEYWLSIPTGSNTEPDTVVVFEYIGKRFTVYDFSKKLTYLTSLSSRIEGLVFLTGTEDGYVYIQGSGWDDDGVAISSSFKFPWIYVAGDREMWNVLRRMFIKYACPATFTITAKVYADFEKDAITTLSFAGADPSDSDVLREEILARQNLRIPGYHVMFEFINNEKNTGEIRIVGFDLFFNKDLWRYGTTPD